MNKNIKVKRSGTISRNASSGRIVTMKQAIKYARPDAESARQFVAEFYKKHGKAMSQLANE